MKKINYHQADLIGISPNNYLNQIKSMILDIIKSEPTVVLHSDQEILDKYRNSIIALNNGEIIGNANLYPTGISELKKIICPQKGVLNIGELGTVMVDEKYRNHNVGKNIINHTIQAFSPKYDAVVSATVNPSMSRILKNFGFIEIPFPQEYFQEGLTYLASKMAGGTEEFKSRAKCFLLSNQETQLAILDALKG